MSESFDEKLRERLGGYTSDPPPAARKIILDRVSAPDLWIYFYQMAGALFMLLALFRLGSPASDSPEGRSVSSDSPIQSGMAVEGSHNALNLKLLSSGGIDIGENTPAKPGIIGINSPASADDHAFPVEEVVTDQVPFSGGNGYFSDLRLDLSGPVRDLSGSPFERRHIRRIVPKDPSFDLYYNVGAFFLYNRIRPDLTDELYVGEFESPFGISASRIGANLEFGTEKRFSERSMMRLGLTVNNYNQNYSFSIRGTTPDSVSVNIESGLLEPHFIAQHVQVSERVTLVGGKLQGLWSIFRSSTDVLFISAEYQRLIGKGPRFSYQGETYLLMKPNQYLAELGLRKVLWELPGGHVYAMPSIRYAFSKFQNDGIVSVKPFSVGITISYGIR